MTIELDSTLAQAEVLFLSFLQIVADIDRRQAERDSASSLGALNNLRRRAVLGASSPRSSTDGAISDIPLPVISDYLRELLDSQHSSRVAA
jgi:TBC1 domain family member 15